MFVTDKQAGRQISRIPEALNESHDVIILAVIGCIFSKRNLNYIFTQSSDPLTARPHILWVTAPSKHLECSKFPEYFTFSCLSFTELPRCKWSTLFEAVLHVTWLLIFFEQASTTTSGGLWSLCLFFSSCLIWQSCCWGCKNWSKMLFKSHWNLLGCLVHVLSPVTSLKSTVMQWMTPSQEHRTDKLYKAKIKSRELPKHCGLE